MFALLDYGHSVAGGQYAIDICHYLWPSVLGQLGTAATRAPDVATACMLMLSHYRLIDTYNTYTLTPDSNGLEIAVALPPDATTTPGCSTSCCAPPASSTASQSASIRAMGQAG